MGVEIGKASGCGCVEIGGVDISVGVVECGLVWVFQWVRWRCSVMRQWVIDGDESAIYVGGVLLYVGVSVGEVLGVNVS